jgi:hypothetical protein
MIKLLATNGPQHGTAVLDEENAKTELRSLIVRNQRVMYADVSNAAKVYVDKALASLFDPHVPLIGMWALVAHNGEQVLASVVLDFETGDAMHLFMSTEFLEFQAKLIGWMVDIVIGSGRRTQSQEDLQLDRLTREIREHRNDPRNWLTCVGCERDFPEDELLDIDFEPTCEECNQAEEQERRDHVIAILRNALGWGPALWGIVPPDTGFDSLHEQGTFSFFRNESDANTFAYYVRLVNLGTVVVHELLDESFEQNDVTFTHVVTWSFGTSLQGPATFRGNRPTDSGQGPIKGTLILFLGDPKTTQERG